MAKNIKMRKPTQHEHSVVLELVGDAIEFQVGHGSKSQVSKAQALTSWLSKYRSAYDTATDR